MLQFVVASVLSLFIGTCFSSMGPLCSELSVEATVQQHDYVKVLSTTRNECFCGDDGDGDGDGGQEGMKEGGGGGGGGGGGEGASSFHCSNATVNHQKVSALMCDANDIATYKAHQPCAGKIKNTSLLIIFYFSLHQIICHPSSLVAWFIYFIGDMTKSCELHFQLSLEPGHQVLGADFALYKHRSHDWHNPQDYLVALVAADSMDFHKPLAVKLVPSTCSGWQVFHLAADPVVLQSLMEKEYCLTVELKVTNMSNNAPLPCSEVADLFTVAAETDDDEADFIPAIAAYVKTSDVEAEPLMDTLSSPSPPMAETATGCSEGFSSNRHNYSLELLEQRMEFRAEGCKGYYMYNEQLLPEEICKADIIRFSQAEEQREYLFFFV